MLSLTNSWTLHPTRSYRSAVHPADDLHPNKHLLPDLGESVGSNKPKPITFVKSHQDLDKSVSKPMAEYNPDDLIGRTFLLPPNQTGERHRASIKQNVIEISDKFDEDHNTMVDNINFLLDVGQGRLSKLTCSRIDLLS